MRQRHPTIQIAAIAGAMLVGLVLSAQAPTFDVVSIKRHVGNDFGNFIPSPPGLYPSLFTALQTELGLKLVPFVGKNKLLVIDHIERPTDN